MLFGALQAEMEATLATASVLEHPDAKGDQSELNWVKLLKDHLPRRYLVISKAKAIDHRGQTSDEIDLLVVDQQYSPFVFHTMARTYVPAESVYAAFEAKQDLDRGQVLYAAEKIASVRTLERTSATVTHAGGSFSPRAPFEIIGGLLTTRAGWKPGMSEPFKTALADQVSEGRLDIGCTISEGGWTATYDKDGQPAVARSDSAEAVMFFMLTLLGILQRLGTVTALDFEKWKAWITTNEL